MKNWVLIVVVSLLSLSAFAASVESPYERVDKATNQVITVIESARTYYDKDPAQFYSKVEAILTPMIDFPSFTRGVMGSYGTKNYYQSLKTPEEKAAFKANYDRFVATFKQGLINTYGKGLMAFHGNKIEIVPPTNADKAKMAKGDYVDVVQFIYGSTNKYQVIYKMRPDQTGQWLLRNVTIETINVGLLYRNQFADAMGKYKNDFGKVVDNWSVDVKNAEEKSTSSKTK